MAIFDFDETTEIDTVWFLGWQDTDWMAVTYRHGPDHPWQVTYRFRYYATTGPSRTDPWETGDTKSGATATAPSGPDGLLKLRHVCDTLRDEIARSESTLRTNDRLSIEGDTDKFLRIVQRRPWCHPRILPPEPKEVQ